MTVTRNGEVVRTMPITTGKPGWETRSGIKVIMSKDGTVTMDAATLGVSKDSPEYYRLKVNSAVRITSSESSSMPRPGVSHPRGRVT